MVLESIRGGYRKLSDEETGGRETDTEEGTELQQIHSSGNQGGSMGAESEADQATVRRGHSEQGSQYTHGSSCSTDKEERPTCLKRTGQCLAGPGLCCLCVLCMVAAAAGTGAGLAALANYAESSARAAKAEAFTQATGTNPLTCYVNDDPAKTDEAYGATSKHSNQGFGGFAMLCVPQSTDATGTANSTGDEPDHDEEHGKTGGGRTLSAKDAAKLGCNVDTDRNAVSVGGEQAFWLRCQTTLPILQAGENAGDAAEEERSQE